MRSFARSATRWARHRPTRTERRIPASTSRTRSRKSLERRSDPRTGADPANGGTVKSTLRLAVILLAVSPALVLAQPATPAPTPAPTPAAGSFGRAARQSGGRPARALAQGALEGGAGSDEDRQGRDAREGRKGKAEGGLPVRDVRRSRAPLHRPGADVRPDHRTSRSIRTIETLVRRGGLRRRLEDHQRAARPGPADLRRRGLLLDRLRRLSTRTTRSWSGSAPARTTASAASATATASTSRRRRQELEERRPQEVRAHRARS